MMRKISFISFALLLIAAFSFAATSASSTSTSKAGTTSKSMSKSSTTKREGTIQKVDTAMHTIVVMVGTDSKTFKFSDKTSWMKDGKKVKSMDLKEGDKITVYSDSKNFARRIEASPHTS